MSSKWAWITGGNRGIGKAIALKLAHNTEYNIVFTYCNHEQESQETLHEIQQCNKKVYAFQLDFLKPETFKNVIDSWTACEPEACVEVLVNNAGFHIDNLFVFMEETEWHQVIQSGLNGFYYLTQHFVKSMLLNKLGRIINLSSVSGIYGHKGQINYAALKGAINAATKTLALEVAKKNITVNAVAPGLIDTDMTAQLPKNELCKQIPMGRFGKPDEVASLVQFLASKEASYITGQIINISGGLYT
ncbi:MAG: 3-oxoacyl-ACP reductase FabG [Alphaproteobacteria bacterium]|nr:3-oxoacyl-ACP reductase FabG [Alphaproteobacteria bacterium]